MLKYSFSVPCNDETDIKKRKLGAQMALLRGQGTVTQQANFESGAGV